jgi:uncharacterized protein
VIVLGKDGLADSLYRTAIRPFAFGKAVLQLSPEAATSQNLPPALAQTVPNLPAVRTKQTAAIVCSDFTCQPPVFDPQSLLKELRADQLGR